MRKVTAPVIDDAANPLRGQPPAPDLLKNDRADGVNPNASTHFKADPEWKDRPAHYPAAKSGLLGCDPQNSDKVK